MKVNNFFQREDRLTWLVAAVGIIIMILLSYGTIEAWNAANPPPKTPGMESKVSAESIEYMNARP
jgi:heme/copper-type cytochrome/quinol oxidase subunit 2